MDLQEAKLLHGYSRRRSKSVKQLYPPSKPPSGPLPPIPTTPQSDPFCEGTIEGLISKVGHLEKEDGKRRNDNGGVHGVTFELDQR